MYNKYYVYKEQVSYDGGITWSDTSAVTPSGDPISTYDSYEECMGIVTCDCSAFTVSSASISVPISGGTYIIGTFSDECIGGFSYSYTTPTGMILSTSVSGGTNASAYTVTISSNSSTETRSGTITLTYNADSTPCTSSTITISQEASTPTCDCSSFVFSGTIESGVTPSESHITFTVENDTSAQAVVGTFELFHTDSISIQVPIDVTLGVGVSTSITVDISGTLEGNTITRVEGVVNNVSHCYEFHCPVSGCDLGDGDTLNVKLSEQTTCS